MTTVTRQPITATGTRGFMMWLRERQPYLYQRIEKKIPAKQLAGLGIAPGEPTFQPVSVDPLLVSLPSTPTTSGAADMLKNLLLGAGQVYLTKTQLDAQKKILDLQLERARNGFPPADIDPTQYGLPAPNVKLGLDADTKKMLMIGGGIAGGLLALYLLFGGRRRRRA